jgi:two-component system, sensor histidine kinase
MQFVSAELARSALDAAPDAMLIVDGQGIIRFANRQASALFGYPRVQLVGQGIEMLMPERFRARHVAHRESYMRSLRVRPMGAGMTLSGLRQDGGEFSVEISLSPIPGPDGGLVAAAIRDVTDRKRVESELKVAREASERARESADRANQAKSRFLATASHDLRQPLQTLALLNGTLRRMITSGGAVEVLAQQEQAIGAMSRLLNALLDISKLESGAVKPAFTDFRIAALLEGLRREFASIAASKGLELQVDCSGESAYSDPSLVEQILKNLLSNAIKYTRQGRVLLRSQRQGAAVRIDVLDTGIGIAPEQLSRIYEEFYQVGVPANASREGYGLGLSIVQRVVSLLNLRLEVQSEVGKGSVFSLLLPVGRAIVATSAPQSAPAAARAGPTSSPRVLLVEDDPAVRDATRMLLKVEGYRVTAVASLAEARHSVEEQGAPDLLITDYHLRDGELGTQVISELRGCVGPELKAVLITGDTSAAVKEMPADAHSRITSKPINTEELLALLQALLAG